MIQIIGLLLCIYLIFKGVEIFQIAYVTERKWNEMPFLLGVAAVIASVVIAALFAFWLLSQGAQADNLIPRLP